MPDLINNEMQAFGASDPLAGQQQRPHNFHIMSVGITVVIPSTIFLIVSGVFTFCYYGYPVVVWTVVFFCSCVAMLFMAVRQVAQGKPMFWFNLGIVCAVAICAATASAYANYVHHIGVYFAYEGQREYTNVVPSEPALSHMDAGKLLFSNDARIVTSTLGKIEKDGRAYCVTPVVGDVASQSAEYYAAGVDCCSGAEFACVAAPNSDVHAGLVYLEGDARIQRFREAALEIQTPSANPDALFLKWVADPDAAQREYFNLGLGTFFGTAFGYAAISIVVALGIHLCQRKQKA